MASCICFCALEMSLFAFCADFRFPCPCLKSVLAVWHPKLASAFWMSTCSTVFEIFFRFVWRTCSDIGGGGSVYFLGFSGRDAKAIWMQMMRVSMVILWNELVHW